MKRGDVWTVAGGGDYVGKPRPAIILQDDVFDATASVTICPFTTHAVDAPLMRLPIDPAEQNGLRTPSQLMIDKITTVSKNTLEAGLDGSRMRTSSELIALSLSSSVLPVLERSDPGSAVPS